MRVITVGFSPPEVEREWSDRKLDPRVRALALYLAWYTKEMWGKPLVVTDIYRSDERQKELYKNTYDGAMPPFGNPHGSWRCLDLRAKDLTPNEISTLEAQARQWWPRGDNKLTLLYHQVGTQGYHFHLQVPPVIHNI